MAIELIKETRSSLELSVTNLLALDEVDLSGGSYAMRKLNENHVTSLMLSDRNTWPPILVTRCREGYVVIDGYHRREALTRLGIDLVMATCQAYESENDVIEAAFLANLQHGLTSSIGTRSDYAYWLHLTYPNMSQEDIATRAGVKQSTVSRAIATREKLALGDGDEEEKIDITKTGRQFIRKAVKLVDEISSVDQPQLLLTIQAVVKEGDREKLTKLADLLDEYLQRNTSKITTLKQFKKTV